MMLNYSGQICLINLKTFPYIEFCIDVVMGNVDQLNSNLANCGKNLRKNMMETLELYGVVLR